MVRIGNWTELLPVSSFIPYVKTSTPYMLRKKKRFERTEINKWWIQKVHRTAREVRGNKWKIKRVQLLTEASAKFTVFGEPTSCSLIDRYQCCGSDGCLSFRIEGKNTLKDAKFIGEGGSGFCERSNRHNFGHSFQLRFFSTFFSLFLFILVFLEFLLSHLIFSFHIDAASFWKVFKLASTIKKKQHFEGHLPNKWSPNCAYHIPNCTYFEGKEELLFWTYLKMLFVWRYL